MKQDLYKNYKNKYINEMMYYTDEFAYVTIIFCDDTILRLDGLGELRDFLNYISQNY